MIQLPRRYKNKAIAVFGLGISGTSAIRAIERSHGLALAWDDNQSIRKHVQTQLLKEYQNTTEPPDYACNFVSPLDYNWAEISTLILSPGIPTTFPSPHWIVQLAQKHQCRIKSDVELFLESVVESNQFQNCPKVIAVTGTNGKSTTTALLGHILNRLGLDCEIGGNIGYPALDLKSGRQVYVLELSSFQIDLLPASIINSGIDVSILLNITPDHIDRHGSFDNYVRVKEKLVQNTKRTAIICVDSMEMGRVYDRLLHLKRLSSLELLIRPVSSKSVPADVSGSGSAIVHNEIFRRLRNGTISSCKLDLAKLKLNLGTNSENIIAAFTAVLELIPEFFPENTDDDDGDELSISTLIQILEAIESFPGLPHRSEFVGSTQHITFVNDSKSTNADSSEKTLLSCGQVVYWILGGKAKQGGIESLVHDWTIKLARIKKVFLIGESTDEFATTLRRKTYIEYRICGHLENALKLAINEAQTFVREDDTRKITILLSPACASFDQWKNFEERGDAFRKLVQDHIGKGK